MRSKVLIILALVIGCESPAVIREMPLTTMPFKESNDSMISAGALADVSPVDAHLIDRGLVDVGRVDVGLGDMSIDVNIDTGIDASADMILDMAPVEIIPDMIIDMEPVEIIPDMSPPPVLEVTLRASGDFRQESTLEITPPFAARFGPRVCTVYQSQPFCEVITRSNPVHQIRIEDAEAGVYLISALVEDDAEDGRLTLSVSCGEESETIQFTGEIDARGVWDGVSISYPSCELSIHNRFNTLSRASFGNGLICRDCERAVCDPHLCSAQSACDPLSGVCSASCSDLTCNRAERCSASGDLCEHNHCEPCERSSDCAIGFDCLDTVSGRACHMRCNQTSDCRANENCAPRSTMFGELRFEHNYCVDELRGCDVTQCVDDLECEAPLVCAEAIQICAECGDATDCPLERPFCDQNICVVCREDQDCIDGQICENNSCIPTPGADRLMSRWDDGAPQTCTLDQVCTIDEVCEIRDLLTSTCTLPCNTRLLCPENTTCCDQICYPNGALPLSCQ